MNAWYIREDDGTIRGPVGMHEWGQWATRVREDGRDPKRVALDEFDGIRVSTVFLGLDHDWSETRPILFETMIFNGPWDEYQWRYATEAEARESHERIVAALKAGTDPTEAVPS